MKMKKERERRWGRRRNRGRGRKEEGKERGTLGTGVGKKGRVGERRRGGEREWK